jgi:hypothetical protein
MGAYGREMEVANITIRQVLSKKRRIVIVIPAVTGASIVQKTPEIKKYSVSMRMQCAIIQMRDWDGLSLLW